MKQWTDWGAPHTYWARQAKESVGVCGPLVQWRLRFHWRFWRPLAAHTGTSLRSRIYFGFYWQSRLHRAALEPWERKREGMMP